MKTIKNYLKTSMSIGLVTMALFIFAFAGQINEGNSSSMPSDATAPVNGKTYYGFCDVSLGEGSELKRVVSSVFPVDSETYHVAVQNSFYAYVKANFEDARASASCFTTISSYQKADDRRNEFIGNLRSKEYTVHTVTWSYAGD